MNSTFIPYEEKIVWGLKIGFRGVIFPGSGCIYLETVQYGCFCLKIPEIVADIYIGTVQTSAHKNISKLYGCVHVQNQPYAYGFSF